MKNQLFDEILKSTPKEIEIFVKLNTEIVLRINELIEEKGLNQKKLAFSLDKKPSEISKWLKGEHNLTLRTIAKLTAELGQDIIEIPRNVKASNDNYSNNSLTQFTVYKNENLPVVNSNYWLMTN